VELEMLPKLLGMLVIGREELNRTEIYWIISLLGMGTIRLDLVVGGTTLL